MITKQDDLKTAYNAEFNKYDSFCKEMVKQLNVLLEMNNISLAVPLSYRIKEWSSIENKLHSNRLKSVSLPDITDLAGIRIISLFRQDLSKIQDILRENFVLIKEEDTSTRLTENQFGYGSIHFEISLPNEWITIPTNRHYIGLVAEIQVRTIAQHTWAAASHVLNYKNERDVPLPIKRSINRVAALLETVDLEYERVLSERSFYSQQDTNDKDTLNVDLLINVLNTLLPLNNKDNQEDYSELLEELSFVDIKTVEELENIIKRNLNQVLKEDQKLVEAINQDMFHPQYGFTTEQRLNLGVYFNHAGLIRCILEEEFGTENTLSYHRFTNL